MMRLNIKLPKPMWLVWFTGSVLCAGCLSPLALDYAVLAYDKAAKDILCKQLLLNIARAHQHQPLHFSGVSNIAATFNFEFNAGISPAFTGDRGGLLTPVIGGSLSENPTISIVPMEGEEFSHRLLEPLAEAKLTMLLRQGADVDLVLRLFADKLHLQQGGHDVAYVNRPGDREGYRMFRQVALHLSAIQDRNALHVSPLLFERSWTLPAESLDVGQLAELQNEFAVDYNPLLRQVKLTRRIQGHSLLSNYNPAELGNEERQKLNAEADQLAANEVLVDIRPGHEGGAWAVHGRFRLRSFYNVLNFVGQSVSDDPEFAVKPHALTPPVKDNPAQTLALVTSGKMPRGVDLGIQLGSVYYTLKPDVGYPWNLEGFRLLYQVFQMTMSELSQQNTPDITIAK